MYIFVYLALAYPQNYLNVPTRFPPRTIGPMAGTGTGTYNPDIVNAGGVQCSFSAGIYAVGAIDAHAFPKERTFDGELRIATENEPDTNSYAVTGKYTTMCASLNAWEYAAWNGTHAYDPYAASADSEVHSAIVVGDGIGALAAARAMKEMSPSLDVIVIGPDRSTTSLSTGIGWFPDPIVHNTTFLFANTPGSGTANETFVEHWIQNAPTAFVFWDRILNFTRFEYPHMDPTSPDEYSGLPGHHAYAPSFCIDGGAVMQSCGRLLVNFLREPLDHRTDYVDSITRDVSGDFLLSTREGSKFRSRVLVLGTGGTARRSGVYTHIHATEDNTGIAESVAETFDLEKPSNDRCYYLPYVSLYGSEATTEWFPITNCEADCGGSICEAYNARGQHMTALQCGAKSGNITNCDGKAQWWRTLLAPNLTSSLLIPCLNVTYFKGVIDCKGGFKVDTDFASPTINRLYASGTTASAFTGDTYFAPGATIGLGFFSGYEIALTAPARSARAPAPTSDFPLASLLFTLAAVGFIEGIAIHAFAGYPVVKRLFKYLERVSPTLNPSFIHGADMVISFILLSVAIVVAMEEKANIESSHKITGRVTYLLLLLQIIFGIILYNNYNATYAIGHKLHALFVLVPLLVYLYISGTLHTIEMYDWHEASWIAFTILVGIVWLGSLYNLVKPPKEQGGLFEILFVA